MYNKKPAPIFRKIKNILKKVLIKSYTVIEMVESTEHDSKKHDYWSKDKYFLQVTLRSTLKYLIAPPFSITPTVDRTQLQGRSTNPYIYTLHNLDAVHEKFIKILMLVHKISTLFLQIICVLRYGCQIVKASFRNF